MSNKVKVGKWITLADWGSDEFLECRKVGARAYQFLRIMDMDATCGRDNEGHDKFAVDLSLVDLGSLSAKQIDDAYRSCGWEMPEDMAPEARELATAEMCFQYGNRAPLFDSSGGSWHKLRREARSEAKSYLDTDTLADALDRPVNALGSTASEYMRGDLDSAIGRGVLAGSPTARLVAKIHGVPENVIDDARPADWLPYFLGYQDGQMGEEKRTDDDLAPEYHLGFDRGVNVAAGRAPAPGWIKQG